MTSSKQQLVRICLFRGTDHARAAIKDLMCVGIPPELIRVIGGSGNSDTTIGGIKALGIAERWSLDILSGRGEDHLLVATLRLQRRSGLGPLVPLLA